MKSDNQSENVSENQEMGEQLQYTYKDTSMLEKIKKTYTFVKDIGRGTFGQVKLALHNFTHQKVAIKYLDKTQLKDEKALKRMSREFNILKVLRHPNISQLYEIFENEQELYLIMEYAEGGQLYHYIIENGNLNVKEACRIFQQIFDALEYLHLLNIVHRDLKPENILFDSQRNVKLIDFGLSNIYDEDNLLKTACGSPCYASPEVIAGKYYVPEKVDIWSLGIILYAMLCGYLPFDDKDTQILYKKILRGFFKIPNILTNEAKDLITKMLCTNPSMRIDLKSIKKHPFFFINEFYQKKQKGLIINYHQIPIDQKVIKYLSKKKGYNKKTIVQSVNQNRHNKLTTCYYLLVKKIINKGKFSPANICDPFFIPQLIVDGNKKNKVRSKSPQQKRSRSSRNVPTKPTTQRSNSLVSKKFTSVNKIVKNQRSRIKHKTHKRTKMRMNYSPLKNFEIGLRDRSRTKDIQKNQKSNKIAKALKNKKQNLNNIVNQNYLSSNKGIPITQKNFNSTKDKKLIYNPKKKVVKKNTLPAHIKKIDNYNNDTTSKDSAMTSNRSIVKSMKSGRTGKSIKSQKLKKQKSKKDKISVLRGPFNLNSITMNDPKKLLNKIIKKMKELDYKVKQVDLYTAYFRIEKQKFKIQINRLENFSDVYYVKFYKSNSDYDSYLKFCNQIQSLIKF